MTAKEKLLQQLPAGTEREAEIALRAVGRGDELRAGWMVPKGLRDELGFMPGTELTLEAVNGRLEIAIASRVRAEAGPHGPRFVADKSDSLNSERVRELIEASRR